MRQEGQRQQHQHQQQQHQPQHQSQQQQQHLYQQEGQQSPVRMEGNGRNTGMRQDQRSPYEKNSPRSRMDRPSPSFTSPNSEAAAGSYDNTADAARNNPGIPHGAGIPPLPNNHRRTMEPNLPHNAPAIGNRPANTNANTNTNIHTNGRTYDPSARPHQHQTNANDPSLTQNTNQNPYQSPTQQQQQQQPRHQQQQRQNRMQQLHQRPSRPARTSSPPTSTKPDPSQNPNLEEFNKDLIFTGLKRLYRKKILPLELSSKYGHFHSPPLSPSDFEAKPMVLLLGQYSVGKTSFIKYLLGSNFPGMRIGPEPTTDRFTAILHGRTEKIVPGAALCSQTDRPFRGLSPFGNNFLSRLEGAELDAPILQNVTH